MTMKSKSVQKVLHTSLEAKASNTSSPSNQMAHTPSKKKQYEEKWKKAFKTFGKPGAASGNAIAVEIDGVIYDTLTAASAATGKPVSWIKKNGKLL